MTRRQPDISQRLSLNQITVDRETLPRVVDACARHGIRGIGLWRHKVAETGLATSARLVREAGLQVSSLCRGGWFDAPTAAERRRRLDDNRRAIAEAAELGTRVLVLVCGPAASQDLGRARERIARAIELLLPTAAEYGVRLGLEPLHPMFTADRSVLATLEQANTIVRKLDGGKISGVVIDVYHVWWDPLVEREIKRAAPWTIGFHVSDWIVPTPDFLLGRGMMGDGVIEIRRLRSLVDAAGYKGPIEVEILNEQLWRQPMDSVLSAVKARFAEHV